MTHRIIEQLTVRYPVTGKNRIDQVRFGRFIDPLANSWPSSGRAPRESPTFFDREAATESVRVVWA